MIRHLESARYRAEERRPGIARAHRGLQMSDWTVYKFGGTSVKGAERLRCAADLVRKCPTPVVTVVSAMGGVTNLLVNAVEHSRHGRVDQESLDAIRDAHHEAAGTLGIDLDLINPVVEELEALLSAAATLRGASPQLRDRVLVTGERLSARLLAAVLNAEGAEANSIDADTFLDTNGHHGEASPVFGVFEASAHAALAPLLEAGRLPVVTGFCGRAPCGSTTTLGRGGSDYSATLIASAIDAQEVVIWTDVPGVYSAHPGVVPGARVVPQLNYREAGELAYYGAKVLHPRTLQPLIKQSIPATIKSTFDPEAPGTRIDRTVTPGAHPVKGVSAVGGHALISLEGTGMAGVPGIAQRVFATMSQAGISVTMISQSSSESSVCIAVPSERATDGVLALREAFRLDLGRGDIEDIRVEPDVSLVAAVGLGMHYATGVAGRVFSSLGRAGVNVRAIAQGASELNITFTVDNAQSDDAVRTLHDEFGLHNADPNAPTSGHADIVLVGFGGVGKALARQIEEQAGPARLVAVVDRRGAILNPSGLSSEQLERIRTAKAEGGSVASVNGGVETSDPVEFTRAALASGLRTPIVVDVADGDTSALHVAALESGADVVTANKAPLASPQARYRQLTDAASAAGRRIRNEATVGAGLPIIDTVEQLVASGDRIRRLEGCLSGTLTYVLGRVGAGDTLATVLQDASDNGYLEPNPLVDLSGEDVLRKAIILSRTAGLDVADDQIACAGLVDRSAIDWAAPAPSFDEIIERCAPLVEGVNNAQREGAVLRYVAVVEPGSVVVKPRAVDPGSPLGRLDGTDNMLLIHSDRYDTSPLVISGPGAGVEVTAMGVLTDILRLIAERHAL